MTSPVSSLSEEKMDSPTSEGMFGETFTIGNGEEIAVEPLENGTDGKSEDCKICEDKLTQPRVLSCLHVFCELCIDKLLLDGSNDSSKMEAIVKCPSCDQSTKVERNAASSLPSHFILTNILDLASIDISTLVCTSCKSKDKAISRCSDCANFLCVICDNAHRFMRCFEEHQVITLEVKGEDPTIDTVIHKPLYCSVHSSENLKFYCYTCEIPVCNDCLVMDHKATEHRYEIISEAEKQLRTDIEKLLTDTKAKIELCDQDATKLESSLQELQNHHDAARDVIMDAYEGFQSLIEKCKEKAMIDLKMLHTNREIQIMEQCHNVEKTVEQMEYSANFTRKLLDNGNGPEVLSLKKMVSLQLTHLIEHMPKIDVNCSLEFQTNFKKFEEIAVELFGKFRVEKPALSPKESTPPPTLPGMPPMLSIKNSTQNGSSNVSHSTLGSVTASSPISLPTSMQSSFDGDNSGNCYQSYLMQSDSPTPSLAQNVTAVSTISTPLPVSSMVEYNLHRLANLCESDMNESILPQSSVSTSNTFTLNDMMSGDLMLNNLQALAKIGLNSNGGDISNGSMMSSSGHDNLALMNDFGGLSNSTSPILPNSSGINSNDEMRISSFSHFAGSGVAGRSKATPMQIRTKFGSLGPTRGQFNSPHGFCLGLEEEIIVADTNNHRIEVFDSLGNFKFHFGVPGKEEGQLWFPRKVAVMRTNSKFVVCDRGNERSRMQIFTKNGHFIKKIAIRYIDIVAGLAVTNQGHIVAVDSVSPTVFIISEDGDLVHWFDCSDHMREPSDIAISGTDFYVCDFKGHCVAVFSEMGQFKCRIGSEKVTCFPNGIDISDAGDVLIGDSHGNRFHVACYNRNGILQSEYECPYVKVSRCCGLKITSEGLIVTLAKNNHHVLVLNTLYIQ